MTNAEPNGHDFSSHPDPARLSHQLYAALRYLAEQHFRDQPTDHTLQPTALVNEAILKLLRSDRAYTDEKHLFRVAANAMRQVLVDHARKRTAAKRGGDRKRELLHENSEPVVHVDSTLLLLDEALEHLRRYNAPMADVVELRFFGGLTEEHAADILGVCRRTVQHDWDAARAWLSTRLGEEDA